MTGATRWNAEQFTEWLSSVFESADFDDGAMPSVTKHRVIDSQRQKHGVMVLVVDMLDGSSFDVVVKEHGHPERQLQEGDSDRG